MANYATLKENKQSGKWEAWFKGQLISSGRSKDYIILHINGGGSAKAKKLGIVGVIEGDVVVGAGGVEAKVNMANPVSITKRFEFLRGFTDMVIKGDMNSLIVTGEGGLGKTFEVTNCFKKAKLRNIREIEYNAEKEPEEEAEGDYIVFKGNISAKGLYRALYDNRNKYIIFDDCDKVLKDEVAQQILKSALDSYDTRIISWELEMKEGDYLPKYFEFNGQVIFISNMPQHKLDQAVKSRSLRVDLSMLAAEKIQRMTDILKDVCPEVPMKVRQDCLKFLDANKDKATDLNIRTLLGIIKIAATGRKDWKAMAEYTLTA